MRGAFHRCSARWIALLAILWGGCWRTSAQRITEDVEPKWFRGQLNSASLGVYTEGYYEKVDYHNGISSTYERMFEGPLIGLGMNGSIYHPNLLQYEFNGDGSVGWTQEKSTSSNDGSVRRNQYEYLGNFEANAIALAQKPYRSRMFVTSGHTYQEYDFFTHVLVDSLRYGMQSGYMEGPVPFNISVTRVEIDNSGNSYDSTLEETSMTLDAHNDRANGRTTFNYNFNDLTQNTSGSSSVSGTENLVGLGNVQKFGDHQNIELRNDVSYGSRDFSTSSGDVLTTAALLSIEHRTNLWSTYDAHYIRDEESQVTSENSDAGASLKHQLFSSLTSGLRFRASHYETTSPGSEFDTTEYLGTWSELYTKKLSESTRLTLGGSFGRSHTDQSSSSIVAVIGEPHTFGTGGPFVDSFYLNVLNALPDSVQLYNARRTIHYTLNVDYTLQVIGPRTVLQLIQPNNSGLTPTTPVVVDYQAAPQGSGSIDGNLSDAQIRLDFFGGMWGIYARYNNAQYSSDDNILVQDITSETFGTDFNWRWLRAGFEYEIYDATFESYDAARAFQTLLFTPDAASTLSINFSEGWTDYHTAGKTEEFYRAVGRYHRSMSGRWSWDLEAGVTQRQGSIVDEFLAAVRPGISYTIGKLSLKAGYNFEYQDTQNTQTAEKHSFFFRAQRSF